MILGKSKHCPMTPLGEDQWKITPECSWTLPYASLSFAVIHLPHNNSEYNCFAEFCESFLRIVELEGGLGDLLNCSLLHR